MLLPFRQDNLMENLLRGLVGKRADVYCGSSTVFRGRIESVDGGVLAVADDTERLFHIDIGHVIAISEVAEAASRPGFLA